MHHSCIKVNNSYKTVLTECNYHSSKTVATTDAERAWLHTLINLNIIVSALLHSFLM